MGRETRRVPADWQHPRDDDGSYIPLYDGSYRADADAWREGETKWAEGLRDDWNGGWKPLRGDEGSYTEWTGRHPDEREYMPDWPDAERTHLMMYEITSEGTPISPAFETPEELARWLTDNDASAFAGMTATYDQWLATCRGGWAPSAIVDGAHGLRSGVAAMADPAEYTEAQS